MNGRIVTWSGGKIEEGKEGTFSFSAHMPATPGQVLVFPALVTYANGKVVHWIGAESSDTPAPRVELTAAQQTKPPPPPAVTTTATTQDDGDDSSGAWVWLVVAAGRYRARRARRSARPETPRMRRALVVAAVALTAVLLPAGAGAHYGTAKLGYHSTIRGVKPPMHGLELKVLYGDDQVWLDNRSGKTVVIDGYSGEPYLRFGPDGIYVNVNSPAGYLNQDRYAQSAVPKSASAKAPIKWEKLAGGDVWAWHDHRIHYMSRILPPDIRERAAQAPPRLRLESAGDRERQALLHHGQPRLQAAAEEREQLPAEARYRARDLDRPRDGRPLRPSPRACPLPGLDTSTFPSARRMSSTLTSISSPSR